MKGNAEAGDARERDNAICEAVRSIVAEKDSAAAAHTTVTVTDGIVHLWGVIGSEQERVRVRELAESVPMVRAVEDHRREWAWSD